MMLIGIDPHKSTHTATVIEPGSHREVASLRIEASLGEYRRMLAWAAGGRSDGGPLKTPKDSDGT